MYFPLSRCTHRTNTLRRKHNSLRTLFPQGTNPSEDVAKQTCVVGGGWGMERKGDFEMGYGSLELKTGIILSPAPLGGWLGLWQRAIRRKLPTSVETRVPVGICLHIHKIVAFFHSRRKACNTRGLEFETEGSPCDTFDDGYFDSVWIQIRARSFWYTKRGEIVLVNKGREEIWGRKWTKSEKQQKLLNFHENR